jgi:hypothetical protein
MLTFSFLPVVQTIFSKHFFVFQDKQVEEKRRNEERQSFEDEEILQKQVSLSAAL